MRFSSSTRPPAVVAAAAGIRAAAIRVSPNQSVTVITLAAAFLAAAQLDRLRIDDDARRVQAGIFAALGAVSVALGLRFRIVHPELFTARRAVTFLLPLLLSRLRRRVSPGAPRRLLPLAALVLGGTAIDLARIDARFDPGTSRRAFYPATPVVRRLKGLSDGGRFAVTGIEMTGIASMYGLEDVRVHDPNAPYEYEETLRAALGYTGPEEYFQRIARSQRAVPRVDRRFGRSSTRRDRGLIPRVDAARSFRIELIGRPDRAALLSAIATSGDFRGAAFRVGGARSSPGLPRSFGRNGRLRSMPSFAWRRPPLVFWFSRRKTTAAGRRGETAGSWRCSRSTVLFSESRYPREGPSSIAATPARVPRRARSLGGLGGRSDDRRRRERDPAPDASRGAAREAGAG